MRSLRCIIMLLSISNMNLKLNFLTFCLLSFALHLLFFVGLNYFRPVSSPLQPSEAYEFIPLSENKKTVLEPAVNTSKQLKIKDSKSHTHDPEPQTQSVKDADAGKEVTTAQAENELPQIQPDNLLSQGVQIVNIRAVTSSVKRTPEAVLNNIEGKIKLKLFIDENGKLRKITPMNILGYGLDQVALSAAQKLIFLPARIKLDPVAAEIYYTVKFTVTHQ